MGSVFCFEVWSFAMPEMPMMFKPKGWQVAKEDRGRRGNSTKRGYNYKWNKAAKRFRQDNPLCLGCQAVGRTTATAVVDHIVPHKGSDILFWDRNNWQPLCKWHHDVVKQRLENLKVNPSDLKLNSERAKALTKQLSL